MSNMAGMAHLTLRGRARRLVCPMGLHRRLPGVVSPNPKRRYPVFWLAWRLGRLTLFYTHSSWPSSPSSKHTQQHPSRPTTSLLSAWAPLSPDAGRWRTRLYSSDICLSCFTRCVCRWMAYFPPRFPVHVPRFPSCVLACLAGCPCGCQSVLIKLG